MPDRAAVQISRISNLALIHMKSWQPDHASPRATALAANGQFRMLHIAPGEWLAVSDVIAGSTLREHLECNAEARIAAVDLSQGLTVLRIAGAVAREVLTKGCGLDLHPRRFPAAHCTRTRFAQLPVIIECRDITPRFDLYVGRSYSSYLLAWLNDSATEYRRPPK